MCELGSCIRLYVSDTRTLSLQLRDHYMQSSPFRSSMQKKAAGLQCVPINAHLQLFSVMPPVTAP